MKAIRTTRTAIQKVIDDGYKVPLLVRHTGTGRVFPANVTHTSGRDMLSLLIEGKSVWFWNTGCVDHHTAPYEIVEIVSDDAPETVGSDKDGYE